MAEASKPIVYVPVPTPGWPSELVALRHYHDSLREIERLRAENERLTVQLLETGGELGKVREHNSSLRAALRRYERAPDETTPSRESQLSCALGQWLHDFGSTNELSQRTRVLLGRTAVPAEKASERHIPHFPSNETLKRQILSDPDDEPSAGNGE